MRPSLIDRVSLAFAFGLLAVLSLRRIGTLDIGFHLEAGNRILSGLGWPRTDPFTYTLIDRAYIDTSWGFQVLVALVERAAGVAGLALLRTVLVLAIFALVWLTMRLAPGVPGTRALWLVLAAMASEPRFMVRPELLSYLLLALVLYLLHRFAEKGHAPLWVLPVVFFVWANCHSLFILGWGALGCFVLGLVARDRKLDPRLAGWSAACLAVPFLNPYGWSGVVFPFTLATRLREGNVFHQTIGEFASPLALPARQFALLWIPWASFAALAVLAALSLPGLLRTKRYACLLLALAFGFLAFRMIRNVPLLAIATLPGIAWTLPPRGLAQKLRRWGETRRWAGRLLPVSVIVVSALLGLRVFHDAYYIDSWREERFGVGWNRVMLPVAAGEFADGAGLEGNVLNHINFGGYLMWALAQPVFIDGRLEVVGEEFYRYYGGAMGSEALLRQAVRRWDIGWIVFPHKTNPRLLGRLSHDPAWRLVYFDHLAAIFALEPSRAPVDVRVAALAQPPSSVDLRSLPGLGGPERPSRLGRWLSGLVRRRVYPSESYGLGLFHLRRGDLPRATVRFAEAIRDAGGAYHELYLNLASALYYQGRLAEARDCAAVVLEDVPGHAGATRLIGEIDLRLRRSGRL